MTNQYRAAFLIVLLCAGQMNALAESKPLELKWTELAALIQGHRVQLMLANGAKITGEAVVVREDSVVMDVRNVSGSKTYQKGSAAIARGSVKLIKLEKTRGDGGRKLGTVIGVLTGLVVGGYVVAKVSGSAGAAIPLFLGLASGFTLGGYYTGRQIDRRDTLIKVVP